MVDFQTNVQPFSDSHGVADIKHPPMSPSEVDKDSNPEPSESQNIQPTYADALKGSKEKRQQKSVRLYKFIADAL